MKILQNMHAFVSSPSDDVSSSIAYKCLFNIENGNIKEFKKYYKLLQKGIESYDLQKGKYYVGGYCFNFKPYLKRFLVQFRYCDNYEVIYCINKSNIFNFNYISKYNIIDIIEDNRSDEK